MKVFASAVGQVDNVGDTVLRRAFLNTLRRIGPLHVYVGRNDENHLSGLGLAPEDELFRSPDQWRPRVRRAMTRERALYAFDTGETQAERAFALRYLRLAPLLAISRLRGGAAAHLGFGMRKATPWRIPMGLVLRTCSVVTWRDDWSRQVMGVGRVSPDWAFALGSPGDVLLDETTERPLLAVAVRHSMSHAVREKPPADWSATVRGIADGLGLEPVVVAQIERDGPLALELADSLGCQSLTWDGPNHSRHEERLRALYRRSSVVLSDRLHALIIGATEGASPVGLAVSEHDKVTRTLAAVGMNECSIDRSLSDSSTAATVVKRAVGRRVEVAESVIAARQDIEELSAELVAMCGDRDRRHA